ncbi:MAG: flagellar biosynthesis anti-sigma factor FlgM [Bacteroidota bacterium]
MQIKGISNNPLFVKPVKNQKSEAPSAASNKDKIEISSEARNLAKTEFSTERLEQIRTKLTGGFYNKPEILDKVAEKIIKDIIK